jgi:hypothetical protein
VEAESPTGEEYAAARLATVVSSQLQESADQIIESIHASVTQFRGAAPEAHSRMTDPIGVQNRSRWIVLLLERILLIRE